MSFLLDVYEVLAILNSQLQKKNLVFSEYQPLIDATYAKLEYLEVKDGSAVDAMRKCIEIKVEDKNCAYLAGEKLSHYHAENIGKQIVNVRKST